MANQYFYFTARWKDQRCSSRRWSSSADVCVEVGWATPQSVSFPGYRACICAVSARTGLLYHLRVRYWTVAFLVFILSQTIMQHFHWTWHLTSRQVFPCHDLRRYISKTKNHLAALKKKAFTVIWGDLEFYVFPIAGFHCDIWGSSGQRREGKHSWDKAIQTVTSVEILFRACKVSVANGRARAHKTRQDSLGFYRNVYKTIS